MFALFVYLAGRQAIGDDALAALPNLKVRESVFLSVGYTASLATVMVALALASPRLQLPFAFPLSRKLGDISYGVYLIQAPIIFYLVFHQVLGRDGTRRNAGGLVRDRRPGSVAVRIPLGAPRGAADPALGAPLRASGPERLGGAVGPTRAGRGSARGLAVLEA